MIYYKAHLGRGRTVLNLRVNNHGLTSLFDALVGCTHFPSKISISEDWIG